MCSRDRGVGDAQWVRRPAPPLRGPVRLGFQIIRRTTIYHAFGSTCDYGALRKMLRWPFERIRGSVVRAGLLRSSRSTAAYRGHIGDRCRCIGGGNAVRCVEVLGLGIHLTLPLRLPVDLTRVSRRSERVAAMSSKRGSTGLRRVRRAVGRHVPPRRRFLD